MENKSGKIFDRHILKRLYAFTKPYKIQFLGLICIIIITSVLTPVVPLLIRHTLDFVIAKGDTVQLVRMVGFMILFQILQMIIQITNTYLSGWLGQNIIRDIRLQVFQKIIYHTTRFFDVTPIGQLITRTISDIETLANVFSEGIASIIGDILQLVLIIGVMFWIDWKLTLISLSLMPFMFLSTYIFKEFVKKTFNEVRTAVANLNTFTQEHITGMSLIQIFTNEEREFEKFEQINKEHRKANIRSIWAYSVYFPVSDIIAAASTGLIVWVASRGILEGNSTVGTLTAFIMFLSLFFRPIRMLADRFNTLQMGVVSTERLLALLDSQEFILNSGTLIPKQIKGEIEFKNVHFSYLKEVEILKNISFHVQQGETVAIVGSTGAGKSTIINLLNRMYDISSGEILIDKISAEKYDLYALRKHIGIVLQDVFLFSDTIFNNITLYDSSITHEKVIEAAKMVDAHEFIMQLPNGYEYNVMERGATLSTGQRQLISFLRVLVHNPAILILDEATSSIDSEIEHLIQKAILLLLKDRTSIVIAHRLSTIQRATKILVIEAGELQEEGTHEELLLKKGRYAKLHQMQQKLAVVT